MNQKIEKKEELSSFHLMHTFDHRYDKTKGNFVIQVLAEILNTIQIKGVFLKKKVNSGFIHAIHTFYILFAGRGMLKA